MDTGEYYERINTIDAEAKKKRLIVNREYALSNSHIKIGDMVTDHIGTICVESIGIYNSTRLPSCIYKGTCYTKTGKPFKSKDKRQAYQCNLVRNKRI